MMFTCQFHKIVMMDAIHVRWFDGLNSEVTWGTLKKTGDGEKELAI